MVPESTDIYGLIRIFMYRTKGENRGNYLNILGIVLFVGICGNDEWCPGPDLGKCLHTITYILSGAFIVPGHFP